METRLVRSTNPEQFETDLNVLLEEIHKQNFRVVDIKYQHSVDETRNVYTALVMFEYNDIGPKKILKNP